MNPSLTYSVIALGAALGGLARAGLAMAMQDPRFPWATILINTLGSLVIGFFATLTDPTGRRPATVPLRQFVMAGFCGGFTTFSAFSVETFDLLQADRPAAALANVGLSLILCLGAVSI